MDAADCEETKKDTRRFSDDSCYSDDTSSGELDSTLDTQQPQMQQRRKQQDTFAVTKPSTMKIPPIEPEQSTVEKPDRFQCSQCRQPFRDTFALERHLKITKKQCAPPLPQPLPKADVLKQQI